MEFEWIPWIHTTSTNSTFILKESRAANVIGDYRIGKLIGEGAFSKVKLGVHMETGQKVRQDLYNLQLFTMKRLL